MIKAVIFDLDDTLISENEYIKSGFKKVSKYLEKKYKINTYHELIKLFEEDNKNVFNRWFEKNQIEYTKEDITKIVKIYREHKPAINFYDDVISTIKELKEKDIKVGIITDGYIETQKAKLEVINAFNLFDEIIITGELGREFWKPHPKAFEIMKERLQVNYNEMIYVGDNPEKDFYIKKKYPITTIRIFRENGIYKNEEYFQNIKADYEVLDLKEVRDVIFN